jgi:phage tail protein X
MIYTQGEPTGTTVQGDLWDWISYQAYGTTDYLSVLQNANPDLWNIAIFDGGTVINIPAISTAKIVAGTPPWRQVVQVS